MEIKENLVSSSIMLSPQGEMFSHTILRWSVSYLFKQCVSK